MGFLGRKKSVKAQTGAADTLITQNTKITGDIHFSGVLYVDGHIKGNIFADEHQDALVTVGLNGHIEGDVHSPHVVIYGRVDGNVSATDHVELDEKACVTGDLSYKLIQMAMGAEVNGKLVKLGEEEILAITHQQETLEPAKQDSKSQKKAKKDAVDPSSDAEPQPH